MISVEEALDRILALARALPQEPVPLAQAAGRVLAADVVARRAQPPFPASAMDGYALRRADAIAGASLRIVGEVPAGSGFSGSLQPGEAVRIFTGAPVPEGADIVMIQEDTTRDGDRVILCRDPGDASHIRPQGADFSDGYRLDAPRRLGPAELALCAAMDLPSLPVHRRPSVALVPTGDELVMPGDPRGAGQIVASNVFGLKALFEAEGAETRLLPIARDRADALSAVLRLAAEADLVVTIGGASVGDHDLVAGVTANLGMQRAFYKVAMRPGKPLMAGRLGRSALVGLPGNPVSAMICGMIFVCPLLRAMQGLPAGPLPRRRVPLACDIGPEGPREHYLRAELVDGAVSPFPSQDSSLLSVLAGASVLIVRPPHDPPRKAGDLVDTLTL